MLLPWETPLDKSIQVKLMNMSKYKEFREECKHEIKQMGEDQSLTEITDDWMNAANNKKYSYHFEWMGRPIIQYPQDIMAMQELIWRIKPDLIIETGIAHGGSLIYYASLLELLETTNTVTGGRIVGIDIDIREHNREAIESHPMFKRIELIEGSSINDETICAVKSKIGAAKNIMVVLDSNHTHDHVLKELELYEEFVSEGSYLVVFDTVIENMSEDMFDDRPWGIGDNPMTAVKQFLKDRNDFEIDSEIDNKLLITVAPSGYLRRVRK
jgi:cephalosporin hydroxylase